MRPDAVRGHLDGLILAVLEAGPRHGYAVIEGLQSSSGGALDLPTGTVYPALRRLERAGWLSGTWSTVGGRERRTYTLTRAGRHALSLQRAEWGEFTRVVGDVLRGPGGAADVTDPVDAHVAALARRLRGPARLRRSMLAETRSGLLDAADAHRDAAVAVAEFGTVAEIAPDFQAELTAAQGRRTALLVAVLFPVLMVGWDLLWRAGLAWSGPGTAEVRALSGLQDVASIVVACLAGLVALAGLRRRPDPRPITVAAAVVGLVGAVVCGTTAVTMNLRNPETPTLLATNPVVTAALVLSGAALVAILSTTVRSLRVALHRPADR